MTDTVFGQYYAGEYDILYRNKDYEAECDMLEAIFQRHSNENIQTILDLGCGTGNHTIPLAQRGYHVTGIDLSENMLAYAQKKAEKSFSSQEKNFPTFLPGDVRSIELNQTYDAVIMMFAVLGYQITNDDVLAALHTVYHHLKPGGLFICDVWYGPTVLHVRPGERIRTIPTDQGKVLRATNGVLDTFHHLTTVHYHLWRFQEQQILSETEETHTMRFFFPQELKLFFSQRNLDMLDIHSFDNLEQEPSEETWNVVVIGKA